MEPVHPAFVPDGTLPREEMEALQNEIAQAAVFEDDLAFDPSHITTDRDNDQQQLIDTDQPVIAGVDQAFLDDGRAVSAVVALRAGTVVDEATAAVETEIPYIPGLLSFREGNAVLAALQALSVTPDLTVVDGSGRIHFRQAGLATHVGVTLEHPTVGVAKNLLCGTPREPLPERLPEGERVPIEADADVTAPDSTVIGYAYQSRQYDRGSTSINPLYVSPGHRISPSTAVDVVARTCDGYKLPEPTRLADTLADEAKAEFE